MGEKKKDFPAVAQGNKDKKVPAESEHKKGREEAVIKYGMIALGVILAICLIAFGVISLLPTYALSVGDHKITKDEFEYHYYEQEQTLFSQVQQYYPDVSEDTFLQSEYQSGMTYHEFAKQLALERIADIYILLDLVKENNYVYDEEELKDSKENFRQSFENYADSLGQSVDEASKAMYGCKFDVVMDIYENTWISSKYQDDLLRDYEAVVTEDDIQAYYDTYKDDLDSVTLKQLFIATYDTDSQSYYNDVDYADAKARAESAFERAQSGEDFDALITELSEDPSVDQTGGEYTSKKDEIGLPEIEDWAFSSDRQAGDMDLIETQIGFHIVEFESRTGYEEAKDDAKSKIAYGTLLQLLQEKKKLPEYAIGYYEAFNKF